MAANERRLGRRSVAYYAIGGGLFLILTYVALRSEAAQLVLNVSPADVLITGLAGWSVWLTSSTRIALIARRRFGVRIHLADVVTLPLSMNLWSYVIPFRGGLAYSLFLLKVKYGISLKGGLALQVLNQSVSVVMIGLGAIVLAGQLGGSIPLGVAGGLLIASPVFIALGLAAVSRLPGESRLIKGAQSLAESVRTSLVDSLRDPVLVGSLLFLAILRFVLRGVFIYAGLRALAAGAGFDSTVALLVLQEAAALIKVVPGNLGVSELAAGLAYGLIDSPPTEGVMVQLFMRGIALSMACTVGFFASYANIRKLDLGGLRALVAKMRKVAQGGEAAADDDDEAPAGPSADGPS